MDYFEQAKIDYATGTYTWFDLQRKYLGLLDLNQIFRAICEVKACSTTRQKGK